MSFKKLDNEDFAEKVLGLTPNDGIFYDTVVNEGYNIEVSEDGDISNDFSVYKTSDPLTAVKKYVHAILENSPIKVINSYDNWDYALVLFDDYGIMPLNWEQLRIDYNIDKYEEIENYYKKLKNVKILDLEKYIDFDKSLDSDYETIYQYKNYILINDDNFRG